MPSDISDTVGAISTEVKRFREGNNLANMVAESHKNIKKIQKEAASQNYGWKNDKALDKLTIARHKR
jgi:hypothetical protein